MAKSKAIEQLVHEHKVILKVVRALGGFGEAISKHRRVDPAILREIVGFMRDFVDKCHHAKEDEFLFPALVSVGLPAQTGPVAQLKSEHCRARQCTAELASAIDAFDRQESGSAHKLINAISSIAELYALHITKENEVLFPMAERLLTSERLSDMLTKFKDVEHIFSETEHDHWIAVADRLRTR